MSTVTVTAEVIASTERAVLLNDGFVEEWVPLGMVEFKETILKDGMTLTVEMQMYIAEEKGFV